MDCLAGYDEQGDEERKSITRIEQYDLEDSFICVYDDTIHRIACSISTKDKSEL